MSNYWIELLGNIAQQLGVHLPRIAGATLVMLVGWVIASWISSVVQHAVSKAGLGNKLASRFGVNSRRGTISSIFGKIAFYSVMLFVLVAFFNCLAIPKVSEPLNAFAKQVFEFSPRVLSSIAIGFGAWILAKGAKEGSRTGLEVLKIEERIAAIGRDLSKPSVSNDPSDPLIDCEPKSLGSQEAEPTALSDPFAISKNRNSGQLGSLSQSLPVAVYWLVLLLFSPVILDSLNMHGLLEPIQTMFSKGMNYVPNVLGALFLIVVGAVVASIARRVVSNLTASLGLNRFANEVLGQGAFRQVTVSGIAGAVTYGMVLVPILVAALDTMGVDAVTQPASEILGKFLGLLPGILAAIVVLTGSYFVGKFVSEIASEFLKGIGFDEVPLKLGIQTASYTSLSASQLAGNGVLAMSLMLATMQSFPLVGLDLLAEHLRHFIELLFQLLLGSIIIGIGIYFSKLASKSIRASGVDQAVRFAMLAQFAIVLCAVAMGLQRMGLAQDIVNIAFTIFFGGLGLAAAIAFGWGSRDAAKRLVDRMIK